MRFRNTLIVWTDKDAERKKNPVNCFLNFNFNFIFLGSVCENGMMRGVVEEYAQRKNG